MTKEQRPQDSQRGYHDFVDRTTRNMIGQTTGGMAPSALMSAVSDWSIHLGTAPGKQMDLIEQALQAPGVIFRRALKQDKGTRTQGDRRFQSELWDNPPFSILRDHFVLTEDWWQRATTNVRGMSAENEAALSFAVRQMLDMVAPTNFPHTNPDVLARARERRTVPVWYRAL